MTNTNEQEVFLYQEGKKIIEVVLTGRIARKRGRREVILHEIRSADKDADFSTWIKREQLFTVEDEHDSK